MRQPSLPFAAALGALPPALSTAERAPITLRRAIDFVRHPRARRYVIRVRSDASVRVTIPRGGSKREAQAFAERERAWIERQQRRAVEEADARPAVTPDLERHQRDLAKRDLPPRVFELATTYGLQVTRVSVRNQRWRWGSCSPNGHICLNWRLVDMPAAVRDYVIVHELMHLKRMDHSRAFWRLVAHACPDYQAARAWLRGHGTISLPCV